MQTTTPYSQTRERPLGQQDISLDHEPICEVILHNDDVNAMQHVVSSLTNVFGHARQLAEKITVEAHLRGCAIAEVEPHTQAVSHRDQLHQRGLRATINNV